MSDLKTMKLSTERKLDIIFCIDGTGSMAPCIDSVKRNARKFCEDFVDKMTNDFASSVEELNVKVIVFRDYAEDGKNSMVISEWFELTAGDEDAYSKFLDSVVPEGGGDDPENGFEALYFAMTSDWKSNGDKDRQVIVLFTDSDALPIGARSGSPDYPSDMVDNVGLLNTWMCVRPSYLSQSDFKLREVCKRLVMFAPAGSAYEKIQSEYNSSQFIPVKMDEGLAELDFDAIIRILAASVGK